MLTNFTVACVAAAARSYSLETLHNDRPATQCPSKVTVSSVRRGGSLKNPSFISAGLPKMNRLSAPPNQIYSIGDKDEEHENDVDGKRIIDDDSDLPPENSPPPPPIDEICFDENTPIRTYQSHRRPSNLRAIDDLELRESASCNF